MPLYSEHPIQLGLPRPLWCASLSWAPLCHWGSYRVADRGTLSSIPFSSSSLVSFHFLRFSKDVSASRPSHLVCCQALSEKSVAPTLLPPVWPMGPSDPPALAVPDNLIPSWVEDLSNWPLEEYEAQNETTWG